MNNKTVYEYVTFQHFFPCGDLGQLRKAAQTALYNDGRGLGKIAWNPDCQFDAKPLREHNITGVVTATYRGRFRLTKPLRKFEIREGDGNQGEYRRGVVEAWDACEALTIASRTRMIVRPWDVRLSDMQGDDTHASLVSYVAPIYGDSCRWCASASLYSE